ncbi:MAG TPA: serine/threonine-protein kinase, partial [Candidatus Solibacter sp.]|nr:serine/threonine-protein kinase [Candidatus Solibacter sp.]
MTENTIGPYQILGLLGAGGMGEVFKALDTRVGRQVALKVLPESLAQDPERRRRFDQEARLAASLNHPNVMAIYDVGLDRHPPYIVSELVPGESLRVLVGKGPVPPRKAVDIAAQIAAGLAAAHGAGIVHRDLKPENVIVTPDGIAKILDFGVARLGTKTPAAGNATMTIANTALGAVVGTAAYMSPEQAKAQDVDHRSDQFSLGLVLYEMLTGNQPFNRPSAVQTMAAIVEDEPPPIERALPSQLRWVLKRCLAKEREGRYESTRDLARELAELGHHYGELTGTGTGTGTVPPAAAARVRRPRWPIAA